MSESLRRTGSSPHTRGALAQEHGSYPESGIIPAYAGSTSHISGISRETGGSSPHTRGALRNSSRWHPMARDHPRIRGEHGVISWFEFDSKGIIPAYAGSTTSRSSRRVRRMGSSPHTRGARPQRPWRQPCCRDHPRIRGEHVMNDSGPDSEAGSSPHTRGALHPHEARPVGVGIIPAYAGSTSRSPSARGRSAGSSPHTRGALARPMRSWQKYRDHPRIRGEHYHVQVMRRDCHGIIPAYAGSTDAFSMAELTSTGSSPHTRGAPMPGIGPAKARRDHPRIRGEHTEGYGRWWRLCEGSSPHTRGARTPGGSR